MSKSTHFLYYFIRTERIQKFLIINVELVNVLIVGPVLGTDVIFAEGWAERICLFNAVAVWTANISQKFPSSLYHLV